MGAGSAKAAGPHAPAASDTLKVTLSAPPGGTVAEGATGHFEVSVAGSTADGAVTVRYSVSGTAVAGQDYTALSGEAMVAQDGSAARIALEALDDGILDKGETVVLALTGATGPGTVIVDGTAATAMIADEGTVTIALAAVSDTIGEGSAWSSAVTMSTPVADRVSIRWWTSDGTAVAGRDYVAADEVVSFQPGETTKPVEVRTLRDDNAEPVEVFHVSVGPPGGVSGASGASGGFNFAGAQSAFIECSVDFSPPDPRVFMLTLEVKNGKFIPVKAGTVIGTVSANTTDGIPYYELGGADKNKFSINSLTAEITTTAALTADLYDLEVTVHDECGAQASVDVSVLVKQPNRAPTVTKDITSDAVDVGEVGEVDASKHFSDPDGNVLTYTAKSSDAKVLKVSVSGSEVTYKGLEAGGATVTVTADDGRGGTAQQAFLVTVNEGNEAPVVDDPIDDLTLYVGDPPNEKEIDLSTVFSDPDGDVLTYTFESADTDVATATLTGSTLTVTSTGKGDAKVTVTATDPGQLRAQDTFKVDVPNRAPVVVNRINDLTLYVGGGTAQQQIDLSKVFRDPDEDVLRYGAVSSDTHVATATVSGNTLTVTSTGKGEAMVTVTATDGDLEAEDEFDVEVPNRAPVVDDPIDDLTLHVGDSPKKIDLSDVFSDPDGDPLTYKAKSSNTAVATATVSGSTLTVRATVKGEATVTVTATDGDLEAADEFEVEVPNRAPVVDDPIDDLTLYVGEGTNDKEIEISGVFSDPDGDVLRYTVESSNTDVAMAVLRGTKLKVIAVSKGRARVTVTADDQMGGTTEDVFDVRVPNRKPTPVGTIPDDTVDVGESGSVDVLSKFEDPDGDDLDFSAVSSNKTVLEVSVSGSKVTYEGLKAGSATVTVTAEDTGGLTAKQRFDVEVYEPTRPCKIRVSAAALSVAENARVGTAMNRDVRVDASDCGTLRYALTGNGSGDFSVSAAGAGNDNARIKVVKRPNHEARDAYALKLTVSSGSVSHTRDVDISVTDVNEAPRRKGTIGRQTIQVGTPGSVDVTNYFTDEDAGDRLTFSSESAATGRLTVNASGSPVKLTGVAAGSATVTVTAKDTGGLTATQRFDVEVYEPTRPCTIKVSDAALSVAENARVGTAMNRDVSVEASDCGTLRYALRGTGSGDFSVSAVGAGDDDARIKVRQTPNHEARDTYALKLTVSWGSVSQTRDVAITVTDVNEAPKRKGTIGRRTIQVGTPGSVDVANYFTDEDAGDRLTFSSESSATGRLTVNASGSPVTLTGVVAGSATVTVTARDRAGLTATQVFSVKVDPAPKPCGITVSDGALSVPENARVGGVVDGKVGVTTTGDCGTLSYGLSGAGSGDFSVSAAGAGDDDAKIRVRQTLNHEARDSYDLKLTVSEVGGTASGAGDVDISVTDVNEPPKPNGAISRETVRVGRPGSVDVTNYFTDEDAGDRLTFTSESSATGKLTVNASGSPVTLTGVAPGSATVTVTARDRAGLTATQVFSVKVDPAPTKPCGITVSDGALSVPENAGAGADVDGKVGVETTGDCGTLSYSLSGDGAADFTVAAAGSSDDDAKIGVAKALDHETTASYALTLTVSEAGGDASGDGDVAITVTDVNEAPEVAGAIPALTVPSGGSKTVDVSARFRDPDGDALTYEAVSSKETAATVKVDDGEVTVTGVSPGESVVTVTARDAHGAAVSQGFDVTVVNEAPEVVSAIPALTVGAGDSKVVDVSSHFRDPNGDALSYEATSSKETVATVKVDHGEVTVTGVSPGESVVTVTARDTHGAPVSQAFEVTVGPANEAPVVQRAIPALTVEAGKTAAVEVSGHFSDPDDDALSYEASSSDEGSATVAVSGSEVAVTGVSRGEPRVTVTALDGRGGSVSQEFAVTVPNRAPAAVGSLAGVSVHRRSSAAVAVSGAFSDPDGDGLAYRAVAADAGVAGLRVSGSRVTVTGVSVGRTRVTVTADDGHGGTAEQAFDVKVANRAPITVGRIGGRTIEPGERFTVKLSDYFRDVDRDTLTYTGVAQAPGVADASVEGGKLVVVGVRRGRTVVRVTADDGHGGTAWHEFLVAVKNGPPVFGAEAFERSVAENSVAGTAVGDPVAASDGDGDAVTHGFASGGDEALFGIDGTSGQITVAAGAALDYESGDTEYAVRVVASDGTLADTAAVAIRVTDVPAPGRPDAPAVTGGTGEVSVSWRAPVNEGPEITNYDLRYRARAESDWTDVSALGVVLTHTIAGLDAGTAYAVQVRAESSEGAGAWSEPGEGTTATANKAPSFAADAYERSVPENSVAGTAVGEPVTATDDDADDLTYGFVQGGDEALFGIDGASGRITVTEGAVLDYESGDTEFAVRVVASDGTLADTAAVTIQVTDIPPPGRPDAPVVTGGTEQVSATWRAPANEGPEITGYDLRHRARGESDWTDVSALGVVLTHMIAGLEAGTTYSVQVRAVSSEGAGDWSESGEGTTEAANRAPAFDADAYEREVAENSAAGTAVGEPVTATDDDADDLTYGFVSGAGEVPFEIDAGTGRITVAEGVALDHEGGTNVYAVRVAVSDGTLSDTVGVTIRVTDVPAPGRPDAPTVAGGTGEVAVSWSAPANEGPEITGYDLRHRAKGDGEWIVATALGTVPSHTVTGLDAGTAYLVQVRAKSSEGAGDWSDSGEGTTEAANRAPAFDADAYEREVAENSAAGTAVGEPVTAADPDGTSPAYGFVGGGGETLFEIDGATGRIAVAEGTALNYESGDTLHTVRVEASDGELADTASVTIRVTNADDPGTLTLSPEVARVGVELTATLADEDGVRSAGRKRRWQRSAGGDSWNNVATGQMYNPVTADAGKWLRAVFTYSDGHGPGKRAVSAAVRVMAANAAPSFAKDAFERTVAENSPGGARVGKPVPAKDADGDNLIYGLLADGGGAPFEIEAATGRILVAEDAVLNYETGDTLFTVRVEVSDGALADTASVTIRVTDADDPGRITLSPEVARVGVQLNAALTDEDGVRNAGRKRKWQRSGNSTSWNDIATGGAYNPVTADEGKWLRAVFTYRDGHGAGKRAVSDAVKVLAANAAPSFAAEYEREVAENSTGGTKVGAPVAATDPDNTSLSYSLAGGGEALFEIGESTGQITVADGAYLDYESGDTLYTVRVEASDGDLADTASVKIRVTNADDPGMIALSADVARVGVRLTATLMDQDRSVERSKMRSWQRSPDGAQWTMIVQGAERRFYTPTEADRGKYLRAVFTYTDGHGPGKRAESAAIAVVGASTPVVSFGAESYTVAAGGSADVAVLLSPAASSALAVEVEAGDSTHTVTFQSGASSGSLAIGTAGLSASDTLDVRFGTLPKGVAVGVPATTRIVVAAVAGDRVSRSVVRDGSPTELEVEYAQAAYTAVAGGPGAEIVLRVSPAADRRVAVPLTATHAVSVEPTLPDSVVFEPGDSVAAFRLDVPAGTAPGLFALGLGALPEAVSAGAVASATVDIAAPDTGALDDEAFDVGLAVFGRAVAEGARQAIGARIDAVMRHAESGSGTAAPGSAAEWASLAAGTLASVGGLPIGASSRAGMARRSGSLELPTGREAAERLLPRVSFATALGPKTERGRPRIGLWAEGSTQSFRGEPGGVGYDGGLRALTVGADARIGSSALFGVSVMRSDGDLDYDHRSKEGSLGHAMNSVQPYLFLQPAPRIGLWAMAGYGSGDVGHDDRQDDAGASLRMLSGGVRVPLARRGAFGLAITGDAFTVGMRADDSEREGSASRARALLEASWTTGGLKLATQAGARYDAGDADTGGGAETGASVGYAGHGLDLDLRGRLALGSGQHREWGAALRLAFDPGTRGQGFRLAVSPGHGHDRSGMHRLMDGGALQAMTPATGQYGQEWRLDAEAGYGLKQLGGGGALDSYTRLSADGRTRSWSFGTRYRVSQTLQLGVEGSRSRMPGQDSNIGLRLALDFTF